MHFGERKMTTPNTKEGSGRSLFRSHAVLLVCLHSFLPPTTILFFIIFFKNNVIIIGIILALQRKEQITNFELKKQKAFGTRLATGTVLVN